MPRKNERDLPVSKQSVNAVQSCPSNRVKDSVMDAALSHQAATPVTPASKTSETILTPTSEGFDFEALERRIMEEADELTPELLPRLLMQLLKRDSLVYCTRHMSKLFPYIRAQIFLTRAKRNYYRDDWVHPCTRSAEAFGITSAPVSTERLYQMALEQRNRLRQEYRSTPCVCFKQHR